MSLLFAVAPMLGCEGGNLIAKVPLPNSLLPPSQRKKPSGGGGSGKSSGPGCCGSVCSFFKGLMAPTMYKYDTELSLNPPLADRKPFVKFNRNRVYSRFPPVPMSKIHDIKVAAECSVNDVIMAALSGALRRYGAEVRQDPKLVSEAPEAIEFKSIVMIALPRKVNEKHPEESLANKMLFASCPLPIDAQTPAERLERTQEAFDNLKSKAYITGYVSLTNFVQSVAPRAVLKKLASETFSKHSLLVTNVPNATVPVEVPAGGEVMREIHMVFPNLIPQVSILTYNGFVNANLVADPALFPSGEILGRMFAEEFDRLQEVVEQTAVTSIES